MSLLRNIGGYIVEALGLVPLANAAGTRNGAAIDRKAAGDNEELDSCRLTVQTGTVGGSPSAQTLDAKLQDSADGTTAWADITGAAITQITAADSLANVDVDLAGAKQFIRVVEVAAFTAGSSPTIIASSTLQLATNKPS